MRGKDHQQSQIFSYLSPETRVRRDHPLRAIRAMVDEVLGQLSPLFEAMYATTGRPSIPPETAAGPVAPDAVLDPCYASPKIDPSVNQQLGARRNIVTAEASSPDKVLAKHR